MVRLTNQNQAGYFIQRQPKHESIKGRGHSSAYRPLTRKLASLLPQMQMKIMPITPLQLYYDRLSLQNDPFFISMAVELKCQTRCQ